MSLEEQERLEKGQNEMLRWLKGFNIGLIITLLSAFAYIVKKDQLTFDDHQQKQDVINFQERIEMHSGNRDIHMSFDEKRKLIILEQNQKMIIDYQIDQKEILQKVGMDLQEIKNLSRRN